MSKLLEIFGKAITVDTADLIWHWLNAVKVPLGGDDEQYNDFDEIVELLGNIYASTKTISAGQLNRPNRYICVSRAIRWPFTP
jgi:hypothetical protein